MTYFSNGVRQKNLDIRTSSELGLYDHIAWSTTETTATLYGFEDMK